MKKILTLLVTMAALLGLTITAQAATYSSYWTEENGVWRVKDPNGNVVTNAWLCDDAVPENGKDVWYLLDANGNMLTYGLVQDKTGNYYSLEMEHNGYYGMLRYKSGTYDGVALELESSHDGAFAAIKNEAGRNALADKYGVVTIDIDNNNIVYTSSYGNSSGGGSNGNTSETNKEYDPTPLADMIDVWNLRLYEENPLTGFPTMNTICTWNVQARLTGQTDMYDPEMVVKDEDVLYQWMCDWLNSFDFKHMTEMERAQEIKKIWDQCEYAYDLMSDANRSHSSDYYVLIEKRGVCADFAYTMKSIAKAVGLKCFTNGTGNHAFSYVQIDGEPYSQDNEDFNLTMPVTDPRYISESTHSFSKEFWDTNFNRSLQ